MNRAQIAASIEYETTTPPAGLPGDMQPLPGATLRFLSIKAIDGFTVTAALWQPEGRPPAETTILVQVHGGGGNFAGSPQPEIARALSSKGYAALSINNRQHDERVNMANFFELRRDIEAAVATAKSLGYKSIVLQGHSIGALQVVFYAATDWDQAVKGVILIAPFADLPWKSRHVLIQNEDEYEALARASRDALRQGHNSDPLPLGMRYTLGRVTAVTAQHFLTYRDDKTSVANNTFWISRIPQPILLLRGDADAVVLPFEPHALLSAGHAEGSLVQEITYVRVPDRRSPCMEGHTFAGNTQPLIDALLSWLAERHL